MHLLEAACHIVLQAAAPLCGLCAKAACSTTLFYIDSSSVPTHVQTPCHEELNSMQD